jgi:putative hydrolase of the HAD superfamily
MTSVETAIFDYGGVLTTPVRDSIKAWLVRDSIDPASFSRMIKAWLSRNSPEDTPIRRLEIGELSISEFNGLLAQELVDLDGGSIAPGDLVTSMFASLEVDSSMIELVKDVKDVGVRVALLSNSWGTTYPREEIDSLFEVIVISGEVGMRKPNADVFQYTLGLLGAEPDRAVFIDDAEPNTEGAGRLGIRTILHTDQISTRRQLATLIPNL